MKAYKCGNYQAACLRLIDMQKEKASLFTAQESAAIDFAIQALEERVSYLTMMSERQHADRQLLRKAKAAGL